jgi:lipopolysaccharide/colanic/teichoic acid biosynthesis glycosyltransferase
MSYLAFDDLANSRPIAQASSQTRPGFSSHRKGSAAQRHQSNRSFEWTGKRLFDLAGVIAAAPAALLIIGCAAALIALSSGLPIFFTQERIGLCGRRFRIFKLRTMRQTASAPVTAQVGDARVTSIGRILRQYRIDELPQLLNIFLGDMSLIGPRPEQPALVETYRELIRGFDERHLVRPGITGLAQIRAIVP